MFTSLQFNETTNRLGLIQACEDDCLLGVAGISGNSALLKEFTRRLNKWNSTIWSWIYFSYGGIQYDDSNQSNLPSATDELTVDKRIYANVAGAAALKGVAYKDSAGNFVPLVPITREQIHELGFTLDSFMTASGSPQYYLPLGESTYIFPASNTTRSAGFKQYLDRGAVAFASTDTTKTPGFHPDFHEAVHTGATIDWLNINKPETASLPGLKADIIDYERRIRKFYSQKYQEMFPHRIRVRDATVDAQ